MAYTPEQIRQFAQQQGWVNQNGSLAGNDYLSQQNNAGGIYAAAQQYGVDPTQLDSAFGWNPNTSVEWAANAGKAGTGNWSQQINDFRAGSQQGVQPLQSNGAPVMGPTQPTGGFGAMGATYSPPDTSGYTMGGSSQPMQPQMQQPMPQQPAQSPMNFGGQQPQGTGYGGASFGGQRPRNAGGYGTSSPYSNPGTDLLAQSIGGQMSRNLTRNILPNIRQNAMAGGVVGGSRQGIAEGLAIGDTQRAYGDSLTNLYTGQFNNDRQYGLQDRAQQYGRVDADRSYGLANDAMDLNVYNTNQNWMRQGQQDQIGLANQMLNWNQGGINNATTVQNTPMNYWQQFLNGSTQAGGQGGTNGQNLQGNPWLGALGGWNMFAPKG